jgi:antitoxin (DNA-binding transcriptional repressor) of toxin-antitoxin stability system
MIKVSVADAKAKLSEYLEQALAGERVVICRHNTPIVELRAVEVARSESRPIGPLAGRPTFDVGPGFFEPLSDDELELWEGGRSAASVSVPRVAEERSSYRSSRLRPGGRRRRS